MTCCIKIIVLLGSMDDMINGQLRKLSKDSAGIRQIESEHLSILLMLVPEMGTLRLYSLTKIPMKTRG